jgi:hypothetical protein
MGIHVHLLSCKKKTVHVVLHILDAAVMIINQQIPFLPCSEVALNLSICTVGVSGLCNSFHSS